MLLRIPAPSLVNFAYGTITLSGLAFQRCSTIHSLGCRRSFNPIRINPVVWAPPLSLAATQRIAFAFFSSAYLDVSIQQVRCLTLSIHAKSLDLYSSRFPHSDIPGSSLTSSSPRLFAGSHALLRLISPRHPPIALSLFMFCFSYSFSLIVVFHNIH